MKLYCLNNISKSVLNKLNAKDIVSNINDADSIIVRSADMHNMDIPINLLSIARAGSGVNNIPYDALAEKGIVVFNTPGANANSVKELVLCSIFLGARDILGGIKYVEENKGLIDINIQIEKVKNKYSGEEIFKKKICVIGLGTIGVLVANACSNLGMNVTGYDPYISTLNAIKLSKNVRYVNDLKDAIKGSAYVTIHVPLSDKTKKMINNEVFSYMSKGTTLLNFSRDLLVDEDALEININNGIIKKYFTDFPNQRVLQMNNVVAIPHLGASTVEATDNCVIMALEQIKDYIENGNITNSVNYPSLDAGYKQGDIRVTINHKNIPGMINKITTAILSANNANIINMINKSKDEYAYTVLDVDCEEWRNIKEKIEEIKGVLKVRIIKM